MNPLAEQAIGAMLRWILTLGAGWFVSRGIWTKEDASTYVFAAAAGLISLGWSLWQKYRSQLFYNAARQLPADASQEQIKAKVAEIKALAKERTA